MGEIVKPEVSDYAEANGYIIRQNAEKYLLDYANFRFSQRTKASSLISAWGIDASLKAAINTVAEKTATEDPSWTKHFSAETIASEDFNSELKQYAIKDLTNFIRNYLKSLKTKGVPEQFQFQDSYDSLIENRLNADFTLAKDTLEEFHAWTREPALEKLLSQVRFQQLVELKELENQKYSAQEFVAKNLEMLIEPFNVCGVFLKLYASSTYSLLELTNYRNTYKDKFETDEVAAKKYALKRTSIDSKMQNLLKELEEELAIFTLQLEGQTNLRKLVESSNNTYRLALVLSDVIDEAVDNSTKIYEALGIK